MNYETTFLGTVGIVLGLAIIIKQHSIFIALIPIALGIILIFFSRNENKIEQRKDIKPKQTKK